MNPKRFSLSCAIIAVSLCALAFAPPLAAQVSTVNLGVTNVIAGSGTVTDNMGSAVKVDKHKAAAVWATFNLTDSGTSNLTFKLARSADGSTYETIGFTSTLAANGKTTVQGWFDIPESSLSSAAYLKLISIANANAAPASNVVARIVVKKDR